MTFRYHDGGVLPVWGGLIRRDAARPG